MGKTLIFLDDKTNHLKKLYFAINESARIKGIEPVFKITNRSSKALAELKIPTSQEEFKNFILDSYIIFYEGSSDGKRIPEDFDKEKIIAKLKDYRTYFFHDIEHGEEKKIKKKYEKIRKINISLIGKKIPSSEEDWNKLGMEFVRSLSNLLSNLGKEEIPARTHPGARAHKEVLKEFFDDRITIFGDNPVKYRKIRKYGEYQDLADAPIFLSTFYMTPPPQFGNTKSAINVNSEASNANLDSFYNFMLEIEKLWLKDVYAKVLQIDKLMPWSISDNGYMVYGSGVRNLFEALKIYDFGIITMILQGFFGEDFTKTFFIIISSYRKGPFFRDSFIDFYLSNIPMEWDWINRMNDSLDILSPTNIKASSYSLKPYYFYEWSCESEMSLKQVLGGIGRNGYDDERKYDTFRGLILKKEQVEMSYELEEDSWISDHYDPPVPVSCLDEFPFSITNRPPTQEEIKSQKLIGIYRPVIYTLVFDGYGHTIYAVNGWGISKIKETDRVI